MRYIWQHIEQILEVYDGKLPLTHFLKGYYKQHPKLGSRDRKILNAMAYCWYRCARGMADSNLQQKIKACLDACGVQVPMMFDAAETPAPAVDLDRLFPYPVALSEGISREDWLTSMLVQPDLFIRIRKQLPLIERLLRDNNISYTLEGNNCMRLPNGARIDQLLPPEAYVVQDASSQRTGQWLQPAAGEQWYDCCCGAGGKSLLLRDMQPAVQLTVTDRRESIIHNLKDRFRLYGHSLPEAFVTDVSNEAALRNTLAGRRFHHIICDAPCSGSGTWARTPEQLYFFDAGAVSRYAALQLQIATHAAAYLRPGGSLIYMTCSVFAQENEQVAQGISQATGLHLAGSTLVNGTALKADSMYVAVLQRPA